MTPEQLRALERMAAQAAQVRAKALDKRRGIRRPRVAFGPIEARLCWLRCATCRCPVNALEGVWRDDGAFACLAHGGDALHAASAARTLCTHCHDNVATGVWAYGGTAFRNSPQHPKGIAWERHAALCAACGFNAVNWTNVVNPELPKGVARRMPLAERMAWHAQHGQSFAMHYVEWCRLEHDGREAAAAYAASVERQAAAPKQEALFDMTDPEAAWRFLHSMGIAKR